MESTEAAIRRIIAEKLGLEPKTVTDEARLVEDLGAESLDVLEIAMELESEFRIEIPDECAEALQTVRRAIDYITSRIAEAA